MQPQPPASYSSVPVLPAMLAAATDFGLTREEAWRAFRGALEAVSDLPEDECLDEIAGVLAREILAKQRRLLRDRYR